MKYNRLNPEQEARAIAFLRRKFLDGVEPHEVMDFLHEVRAFVEAVDALPEREKIAVDLWLEVMGEKDSWPDWRERIRDWCYDANEMLGGKRPIDLLGTPEGIKEVRDLFETLAIGSVG